MQWSARSWLREFGSNPPYPEAALKGRLPPGLAAPQRLGPYREEL